MIEKNEVEVIQNNKSFLVKKDNLKQPHEHHFVTRATFIMLSLTQLDNELHFRLQFLLVGR